MKRLIELLLVFFVVACADQSPRFFVVEGPQGVAGADGADGADGQDITVVYAVQFCPSSFVPSYPSSFPEVGVCIGNNLYGVYSANNGFMVLLPPGTYSSNGINASCTFTILPNCEVAP